MTEVLLDKGLEGFTADEFYAMRRLDCAVAMALGWHPVSPLSEGQPFHESNWWLPPGYTYKGSDDQAKEAVKNEVLRDEANKTAHFNEEDTGVPYYSLSMNGAHRVLLHVSKKWSFIARMKYWELLQRHASFSNFESSRPQYPDVFVTLVDSLPKVMCQAFLETVEWYRLAKLDPCANSPEVVAFGDTIEGERTIEVDEQGIEHHRYNPKPASSPWVKMVPTEELKHE